MPRRALENPLVLAILGLLLERPMHPYHMLAELRRRSENQAAAITRGSLYDIVDALTAAEWITAQGRQRDGNRPERTVYAVTETGRHELIRRLDAQIRRPRREFPQFLGAVSYLGALGPDGAIDALNERMERLRERTEADQHRLGEARTADVPRLSVIEAEYAMRMAHAELDWIAALVDDIRTGALAWPTTRPATNAAGVPG